MLRFTQTAAPAAEPVTVADLRTHARLDDNGDDAYLARLLKAARVRVEQETRRALITQTWTATFDRWADVQPGDAARADPWPFFTLVSARRFRLSPAPVASVSSLAVDGVTIGSGNYRLDGADLIVKGDVTDSVNELGGGIVVTFTAGYGATGASVPDALIEAILMLATDAYERRGEAGEAVTPAPEGAFARIAAFRVMREL